MTSTKESVKMCGMRKTGVKKDNEIFGLDEYKRAD